MKFMMMTFGEAETMFEVKSRDWIKAMIETMHTFNAELREAGELVSAEGLVDARHAKTIRVVGGETVATDGPFAETKESLVGFWILDVEHEERAVELGTTLANRLRALDPDSSGDTSWFELRRVDDGPPEV